MECKYLEVQICIRYSVEIGLCDLTDRSMTIILFIFITTLLINFNNMDAGDSDSVLWQM